MFVRAKESSKMSGFQNRRKVLKALGAASLALGVPLPVISQARGTVVVVGGGFGGASCARYLAYFAPEMRVVLVEPEKRFITCPFSNTVLGGLNDISYITHEFTALQRVGVEVVHSRVKEIQKDKKKIKLSDNSEINYDRLVLSPGIDFHFDRIVGYSEELSLEFPHAWKAGKQTTLLRQQLEKIPNGGVFVMTIPSNPYRCPPGPYERASLVAHYFKTFKPRSKILLLDDKDKFSKQPLFMNAWKELYSDIIEWVPFVQKGNLMEFDSTGRRLISEFGKFSGDVINIIPPQRANLLTVKAGLCGDGDWCVIDQRTFESIYARGIHVIGDAAIVGSMPKSAFSATSQARLCAYNIAALQGEGALANVPLINTCYSLVAPDYGISVADVYRLNNEHKFEKIPKSGGVSPISADTIIRELEAEYAQSWYSNITKEIYG
jgi:sulfide dehydrogenase [flavocytochrome c] flavoprotein subunit